MTLREISWSGDLLVTGAEIGDRVLWRVTVPRWDSRVKVLPAGEVLATGKYIGLWHETAKGEEVQFELVK